MKYSLKSDDFLSVNGNHIGTVNNDIAGLIRHLESEISKRDERIVELKTELKQKNEQLNFLGELLKSKLAEPPKPSEPFIFTKDTPVRIEDHTVELLWEDDKYVHGKYCYLTSPFEYGKWFKDSGRAVNPNVPSLIPILPEKRVVDVWVCVSYEDHYFYTFENESEAKDFVRVNVEYYIEHHQIELKGQSNV